MSAQTNPHLGPTPEKAMPDTSAESYIRMVVRVEGDSLTVVDAREIAGPLVQPENVTHGVAHEVLVKGRRVAVGSSPDADISRSFSEIGPEGPREHHIRQRDSYELAIRVPAGDLRGSNPSDVTINVLRVHEHPREALDDAPLKDNPVLKPSLIASANLGEVEMPTALGQVMGGA